MIQKLYAHGKQLCGKRMSYDSVRLSRGRMEKLSFSLLSAGLGQS